MKKGLSQRNLQRVNQGNMGLLTMYSQATPLEMFDLRCEYEVPRYVDLNIEEEDDLMATSSSFNMKVNGSTCSLALNGNLDGTNHLLKVLQEEEFFQWFQLSHDFTVNKRYIKVNKKQLMQELNIATPFIHKKQQSSVFKQPDLSPASSFIKHQSSKSSHTLEQLKKTPSQSECQTERNMPIKQSSKTSRNQLHRNHSQVLFMQQQQHLSNGTSPSQTQTSAAPPSTQMGYGNSKPHPQASFTQVQQPKSQSKLHKKKSVDYNAHSSTLNFNPNATQQVKTAGNTIFEKIFSKKRSQNASIDESQNRKGCHLKNKSSYLMEALRTAREASEPILNPGFLESTTTFMKHENPSATRPTSSKRDAITIKQNSNSVCRINFIEHNKQRIKLMSANSKNRLFQNVAPESKVLTHRQHSKSTSNFRQLIDGITEEQQVYQQLTESVNESCSRTSRNAKCSGLSSAIGKTQGNSGHHSHSGSISFVSSAIGKPSKPLLNQVLTKILEASSKSNILEPSTNQHQNKLVQSVLEESKVKRNNRTNSFIQSNAMSSTSYHQKNQSIKGTHLLNQNDSDFEPSLTNRNGQSYKMIEKENNILSSTQMLQNILEDNNKKHAHLKSGMSRQNCHQRNQTIGGGLETQSFIGLSGLQKQDSQSQFKKSTLSTYQKPQKLQNSQMQSAKLSKKASVANIHPYSQKTQNYVLTSGHQFQKSVSNISQQQLHSKNPSIASPMTSSQACMQGNQENLSSLSSQRTLKRHAHQQSIVMLMKGGSFNKL